MGVAFLYLAGLAPAIAKLIEEQQEVAKEADLPTAQRVLKFCGISDA